MAKKQKNKKTLAKKKLAKKNKSKKTLEKKKPAKKNKSKKTLAKKKPAKKNKSKKTLAKKKPAKKNKSKKTLEKKQAAKKLKSKKTLEKKQAAKKLKSKKTLEKKTLTKEVRKTPIKKNIKEAQKTKNKTQILSLNYREKELLKLLNREKEEASILKDMQGRKYCLVENCDYPAIAEEYCRIHYFGLFKQIYKKKKILEQEILEKSYSSLVKNHSEVVFDYLFKDLSSDKDFKIALKKVLDEDMDDLESEDDF